jgi:hypothetical protein
MLGIVLVLAGLTAPAEATLAVELLGLERAVSRSAWGEAVTLARAIEARLADKAPLEVTDGQALAEPASGLGIYHRLADGVVRQSELYLYAQVRNHGVRQVTAGHELHLVSDLIVLDALGNELARDDAFGESRFVARAVPRDTFVNIALRVTGLDAGAYVARLVVHDRIGGKSRSVDIPFRMP